MDKLENPDVPIEDNVQIEKPQPTHEPKTRLSKAWLSLIVFVIILIALLIFIAQNSMTVKIHYLGAKGSIGFGVAMLLSAAAGIVLTLIVGSLRIIQLKLNKRKFE